MPELLRPLGFVERLFEEGNDRYGGCLMIRAVRLSGPCDVEKLRAAAVNATRSLPLLASTIVRHRKKPRLVRLENFQPIVESVTRDSPEHWRQETEQQLTRRLENGGPQWRMVVVHSAASSDWELLLVYNHAIADPVTATVHLERILQEFQQPTKTELTETTITQPLELLLHKENRLRNSLLFIITDLLLKSYQKTMAFFKRPAGLEANVNTRKTRLRFSSLSTDQTTTILQTAKQEGISFQGLLLAAMIRSSKKFLQNPSAPCLTLSNISLRHECGPGDYSREPGCFIFWFMNSFPQDDDGDLLSLAKNCSKIVRFSISFARPPAPVLGAFVGKSLQQLATGNHHGRLATLGVSNIGPVPLPEQIGDVTIREDYSISGQNAVGPEVMLLVSTLAGRLHLTLCFVEPLLSPEQMTEFRDNLMTELNSFV
ncbi:hypothetical protein [uncultured Gimesia sp.]|uniref:phthiocerol/phthiodiolone dimycocerosyl transferase family protein n=1 Tax=uncultured Gimesia sp. TaxID=1678688 RepID=UPI00262DB114|nr:hypothetical protein [uncultured Gimesia sp.]